MSPKDEVPIDDPLTIMDKALADAVRGSADEKWVGKRFSAFRTSLEIDKRGKVGEQFVSDCFRKLGYKVINNDSTGKDKEWDIEVVEDRIYIEVKTATLDSKNKFQRENIYKDRNYDILLLVDVAPDEIYLSWHAKAQIVWTDLHPRKDSTFFKWDQSLLAVEPFKLASLDQFKESYLSAKTLAMLASKVQEPNDGD